MNKIRGLLGLIMALWATVGMAQQTGSTLNFPASGKVWTEKDVQEYVFDMMEKYVRADCDMKLTQIVKSGNAFEFGVTVSLPNITQYTIKVEKGSQKWFWYNVPYTSGQRIRIQNVPQVDSLRVVIRPSNFPTCYVSFNLDGTSGGGPVDPDPDPCENTPVINAVTNISGTGITVSATAPGITQVNWFIYNTNSPGINLRSGTRAYSNSMALSWDAALADGSYGVILQAANCTGVTAKEFTISGSTPTTPPCTAGPTILTVSGITTTGITAQFHGSNVTLINWKVKDGTGATVRQGQVAPTSSILNLTYSSAIAAGNYTLRLEGANCTGFSEKAFTLSGGGGGTDPPTGNIIAKKVVSGLPEHMDIVVNGTGASKTITDNATVTPPSGYSFRYYINGQQVVQSTRLINFPWPSNVPVMIYKMQIRNGYTGDAFSWGYDEGWKDPNIGKPFSQNTSVAFTQFVFDDENSGYDPAKQTVHWMDYLPDAPATDDKVWVMPIGQLSSPDQLVAKGVTNFSNYDLPSLPVSKQNELVDAGKTYNAEPKTAQQLFLPDRGSGQWVPAGNIWPNVWNTQFFDYTSGQTEPLTTTQGGDKGNQYSVAHRVTIFENSEGNHAISSHWGFWRPYYQNLTSRAQARFPGKWRIAHNYFTGAIGRYGDSDPRANTYGLSPSSLDQITRAQALAFSDAPISQWPGSDMLPGGTLETLNSACYGLYFGSPDKTNEHPYRMIYSADRTHAAGKYLFAYMQEFYEWFPNNYIEVRYPTGKFYLQTKMAHSQAQLFNIAIVSRVFLDGFVPFGASPKYAGNFNVPREFNQGLWYPNGSTSPQNPDTFPYWTKPGQSQEWPTDGFEDGIARGMYAYSQTFMQTSGGTKQFLRFRVNGGSWVEPLNDKAKDIVNAYFDKRGFCYGEVKNGKLAVMYMDVFADNSAKTIEYQYNGVTRSLDAASIQAVVKLITL